METNRIAGRYHVERELGRGGMGIVYLVREEGREEPIALKVLTRNFSESALRHFEHEFRTLTSLVHPNLTEVYDFGRRKTDDRNGEVPFFTMQYVDGETLGAWGRRMETDPDLLYAILAQVGQALAYLHGKGLVHQDVKPSNIMVSGREGEGPAVKLMDLGLAGRPHRGPGPGCIRGTAAYLSPEAARGGTIDPRSDLYSLGCVAYELVTGRPPFQGGSTMEILRGHLQEEPIPPSTLRPGISADFERLVLKLLEKDPGLRFANARRFLGALNEIAGGILNVETPEIRRHQVLGAGFTGREEELARLDALLSESRHGDGRLVLVVGESGVGKSRLLREFQVRCQLQGLDLHIGRRDEERVAGSAVLDALARAVRSRGPLQENIAGRYASELRVLLGEEEEEAAVDQYRLFAAATGIVEDLSAAGPLLLAFEDLHAADEFTCALLRHLTRSVATREGKPLPVLLLGSYRGEEVSRETPLFDLLAEGRDEDLVEEMFLRPLGASDCRSLLRAMLGAEDIPEEFVQRMLEETRGNPLHLGELVALLAEEGHIVPGTGEPPLPEVLEEVELPGKTRSLLERRLDLIPEPPTQVLRAAAVLGSGTVDPDAVAAITGLRWERVIEQFGELCRLGVMVLEEDEHGSPVYRLGHRGLGELAEERTPSEDSTLLHARTVSYMERRGMARRHTGWAVLARHAELGGQPGRAIEAFSRAGDLATDLHAHREAIGFYSRSLELARRQASASVPLLCGLYRRRGQAHSLTGDLDRAEEDFRWMLQRASDNGEESLRARAHLLLGRTLAVRSRHGEAEENLEIALEIAGRCEDFETVAESRLGLGRLATATGRSDDGDAQFRKAEETASRAGLSVLESQALLARGELYREQGDYRASLSCFEKAESAMGRDAPPEVETAVRKGAALALEIQGKYPEALAALETARIRVMETGDTPSLALLSMRLGEIHMKTGDYTAAEEGFDTALDLNRRLGSREGVVQCLQYASRISIVRGRFQRAYEIAEEALRQARKLRSREALARSLEILAGIHLALGDLEGAASCLDDADRALHEIRSPRGEALILLGRGDLELLEGRTALSRKHYQEAAFLARKIGDRRLESIGLCRLGSAHLQENDYDRARIACRKALARVEEAGLPREESDALLLRARIELALPGGDVVSAETDALKALENYRALADPDRLWQAEYVAGRAEIRLGQGDEAFGRIDRAHRYLEKVRSRVDGRWKESFLRPPLRRELYEDWERLRDGRKEPATVDAAAPHTAEFAAQKEETEILERLLEINRKLNSTRETDDLLQVILQEALILTGAERGILLLGDGKELTPRMVHRTEDGEQAGEDLEPSRNIALSVMESGEPLLSTDAEADERFTQFESVHDLHIRSVIAVPLRIQDVVAGALYLDNRLDRQMFTSRQMKLASRLADQAGLALGTAGMLEKIEEQRSHLERLNRELERTVASQRDELALVREELSSSRTSFELRYRFENMIGASVGMQRVYHLIERLAPKKLPVLITGESGTGKELIARALHRLGERSEGPFFTVNCAALTETLLESELFGYRKGAFTGANRDKPGYFELADGGTLFLDEIGDMGLAMQAKLLRAIERGEVLPVGGKSSVRVDVRILSATHRDLRARIADGSFREDLFYRINVGRIDVPPLRDRREDIPLLVDHFLTVMAEEEDRDKCEIEPAALRAMAEYHWPGNVRELQHQILRVSTFARSSKISLRDIRRYGDLSEDAATGAQARSGAVGDRPPLESLEEMEKKQILRALEEAGGNKTRAAETLGINRATLFRKIKRFGLDV